MKLAALEVVRALAALLVLMNHLARHVDGFPQIVLLQMALNYATEAVIVFFVLSGAVITLSQMERPRDIPHYIKARFIRIYPIYLIAVLLSVLAILVSNPQQLNWQVVVLNLLFLQTLQGHIATPIPSNMALWSLSYEMFFYLVIYTTIIYRPHLRWFWLALSVCAGLAGYVFKVENGLFAHLISMLAFAFYWLVGHLVVAYGSKLKLGGVGAGMAFLLIGMTLSRTRFGVGYDYYDFLRLAGFAVCSGALIATLITVERNVHHPDSLAGKAVMAAFGIFAILAMWLLSGSNQSAKIILTGLTLLAIFVPTKTVERAIYRFQGLKNLLVFIGGFSYALYVTHMPVIIIFNELLGKDDFNFVFKIITILGAVMALAVFLEIRFQTTVRRFFARPPFARCAV